MSVICTVYVSAVSFRPSFEASNVVKSVLIIPYLVPHPTESLRSCLDADKLNHKVTSWCAVVVSMYAILPVEYMLQPLVSNGREHDEELPVLQVAQSLHFTGIGAQDLAADFHRLWKYEDTASAHVTLPPSAQQVRHPIVAFRLLHSCNACHVVLAFEKVSCSTTESSTLSCLTMVAVQVGKQYKRVSYNLAHVGKGIETHAKAAEGACAPLRVVASGMHAGKRALEDRNELRAAIAEAQTVVQDKREKYRVFGPEVLATSSCSLSVVLGLDVNAFS
jgi:hypothetical protein